ncbi:hypothetical protein LEM8419_02071 [Neolewinella maritima]|uniref:Uncharacterized protein n=2 Tax=Neolewinella maritima TaxID=1383882 RepID=A0ABM9B1G5_9BACT|nr:hypothetical protein LEM8419_02071 [Neolewinella maritima]
MGACLLMLGCEQAIEVDGTRLRAEYAVPLIDSEVKLAELVGDIDERVRLTVDPDGLLRFSYTDTVPAVTSDEVFDELNGLARGLPLPITRRREAYAFPAPEDTRLTALRAKAGAFTYSLPNPYAQPVRIVLTLPGITRDGEPLQVRGELPAYSGTGDEPKLTNVDSPLDFTGYTFDLSGGELVVEYAIDGLDGEELAPGRATIAAFTALEFDFIEGYFGRTPYPGVSERLEIDFFDNYQGGTIDFVDPQIRVQIRNGFGIPARAVVDQLSVESQAGSTVAVTGRVVDEGFDFAYPRTPGNTALTTYLIDETNSNLKELLATRPTALNYRISALLNPEADESVIGYLLDTSTYTATITVELPLYGSAADFQLRDSFPVNLGEQYGEITAVTFRVTTDNELPFDLSLTGTFLDSLGTVVGDLTDGDLLVIRASVVDAMGNTTAATQATTDIPLQGERLAQVRRASRLVLNITFATSDKGSQAVRVTDRQNLRVRIGARLTVNDQ